MIEIIAEAGVNHMGKLDVAKKLARAAHVAGANIVKYQTYKPELQYPVGSPRWYEIKQWCLTDDEWVSLADYCKHLGIEFMSTPGDVPSLEFLVQKCGVKRIKIGSDDLTNQQLVDVAYKTELPVILSTGMATTDEIDAVVRIPSNTTLLHCVSMYPCPDEEVNLRAMHNLGSGFTQVGYSDHTHGTLACVAAAAMGAVMIEKHLMLHDYRKCPDEAVSVTETHFKYMVWDIRRIEQMFGSGVKKPCPAELVNIPLLRKNAQGMRAT